MAVTVVNSFYYAYFNKVIRTRKITREYILLLRKTHSLLLLILPRSAPITETSTENQNQYENQPTMRIGTEIFLCYQYLQPRTCGVPNRRKSDVTDKIYLREINYNIIYNIMKLWYLNVPESVS